MKAGLYQGAQVLSGLEQWQQQISENIAASQVPGFRQGGFAFESRLDKALTQEQVDQQKASGYVAPPEAVSRTSFVQGELQATGLPTHVAIEGEGFFKVQTPDQKNIYTRNGQFHFNDENILVDAFGNAVMGESGFITQNESAAAIEINSQGQVLQDGAVINKLGVFKVQDPNQLIRTEGGFQLPEGVGDAGLSDTYKVAQGFLEGSNVSPVHQMIQLIQVSKAYEANQKIISEIDAQYGRAIEYLGTA